MATGLTPDQMKQFVREHFEDFVNKRNASVIRKNMTPDCYDEGNKIAERWATVTPPAMEML